MGVDGEVYEFIQDRLGHDFRYSIDTDKIRSLGWKPKIDLVDGLKSTIDWYSINL